ncbi:MAG TPA: divalent-cation tolerance protein CutA [Gammaproteobacteria bacterium]|nr:divalent-cation tolerance protein CutA [Gammaproteobacteria bacterium]
MVRIALTTCPDEPAAKALANALVERRLAACVTRLPGARSVYRWEGRLCDDTEVQLFIKTTKARAPALREAIAELHPYDEPELIILPVEGGSQGYLQWIEDELADTARG